MSVAHDLLLGARILRDLPRFLRHPVSLEEARATLARRRAGRASDFLHLVRRAVYEHAGSPYRALLQRAGCTFADLEQLVQGHGVEGALQALYRSGVYLTVEEFKGRRPLVRGGETLVIPPGGLRNPLSTTHGHGATSGSRGGPAPVPIDLAHVRDWSLNFCLLFQTLGTRRWRHARWSLPAGDGIAFGLLYAGFGAPLSRWFSPVDPAAPGTHARYRWACRLLAWEGRLAGVPLPYPEHVPVDAPEPILRWLVETLRSGEAPHLVAYVSPAVGLCEAAARAGLDLRGAHLRLVGEPVTPGRLAAMQRTGIRTHPDYGTVDAGLIGTACQAPETADEVHLYDDLLATIQPDPSDPDSGLPAGTLLFSSLRPSAPLILLNVSLGDQGTLTERACGCPREELGWTRHLHTIRSFEKLTAGGMTFLDGEVIRILEEVLPARLGGAATDYQLLEEQAGAGASGLRLLVHPRVGPLDPAEAGRLFLEALGEGSPIARMMGLAWDGARLLRVERRPPVTTGPGKILHVHVQEAATPDPGRGGSRYDEGGVIT